MSGQRGVPVIGRRFPRRWKPLLLGLSLSFWGWACDSTDQYVELLSSPDPGMRKSASFKLLLRGEKAVPPLLEIIENGPDSTRYIVVQLLGKIGDERAVQPLVGLLEGAEEASMREETAEALGKLGDPTAIQPLVEVLRKDEVPEVRVEAVRGLINLRLGDPEPLVQALEDWFPQVRKEALIGLVRLQHSGWGEHLLILAKDPDPEVRYIAIQLLGRWGEEGGIATLIEALDDESGGVREEAATALGKLGALEAREALIDLMTRSSNPDGDAARKALKAITGVDYQVVE
jgi:HEAT repeat protein